MPQTAEVTRDQLLASLRQEGVRVSRTMLLRWQTEGVLPQPRRRGLGRGKGIEVFYPRWTIGLAAVIAQALKVRRNLDDAAWVAWVLGFPLTPYVSDLLLDELTSTERNLRREHRRLVTGDKRSVIGRVGRGSRPRGLGRMRAVLRPASLAKALRVVVEQQLGILRAHEYSPADWLQVQDGFIEELLPELRDNEELPSAAEIASGYQMLSNEQNLPRIAEALRAVKPGVLEIVRNEAQALSEHVARIMGVPIGVISIREFLRYFAIRIVNRQTRANAVHTIRLLGWTRPPDPPLVRWTGGGQPQDPGVSS